MNKGFKSAYFAELSKLMGKKRTLKIIIAIAIITIIFTVMFQFIYGLLDDFAGLVIGGDGIVDSQEELEALKEEFSEYQKNTSGVIKNKLVDTSIYQYKARIAASEFVIENNISLSSLRTFGSISISSNGYVLFMLEFITLVIIIFSIVSVGSLIGGELSDGMVKMELLRPVGRDELLSAKYLAVLSFSGILFTLSYVVINILGIILFKVNIKDVLVVVNASKAVMISAYSELLIYYLQGIFSIIIFVMLTVNTSIIGKKGGSIAIPLVIYLIAQNIEQTLGYLYVGYAGIAINSNFVSALTINGPALNYMSIYSMIFISLFYIALNTFLAHVLFKRKDIQ